MRLGVAVGGDREDRQVGQPARDELERQQRRRLGPVQVVEDDDKRPALGDAREQARERVEEQEARLLGVEVGGRGGQAKHAGELRHQARDRRRVVAERGAQRRGVLASASSRTICSHGQYGRAPPSQQVPHAH